MGLVINGEYEPMKNTAEDPTANFKIEVGKYILYSITNDIEGLIHSHNNFAHASKIDMETQIEMDIPWCIINMKNGVPAEVFSWSNAWGPQPLIGRPFHYGVNDCWTLVRDYFRINHPHVEMPNPPREWKFWFKGESLFEDHTLPYVASGEFVRIDDVRQAQINDILYWKLGGSKVWNHSGVVTEDGRLLHHLVKRLSMRTNLHTWLNRAEVIIRHKSFLEK